MKSNHCALLTAVLAVCACLWNLSGCAVVASANNQHTGGDGCVGRGFVVFDAVAAIGTSAAVLATDKVEESKAWYLIPGTFALSFVLGVFEAYGCSSSEPKPETAPTYSPKKPVSESADQTTATTPVDLRMRPSDVKETTSSKNRSCHKPGGICPIGKVCEIHGDEGICVTQPENISE